MPFQRIVLLGIATLLPICGCSTAPDPFVGAKPGQLKILTSFPPLYCFAANIAGEHAKVLCFLTSTGPHGFEPLPIDTVKVAHADLFLINGLGLDDFATKLVTDARVKNRKQVVFEVGAAIPHNKLRHLDETERKHVHADGTECSHGDHDPHVWLSPELAKVMVQAIAKRLGEAKPELKSTFDEQAVAYVDELNTLHKYGLEKFQAKRNRRVIVTHDFLHYFAKAYQIDVVDSIQPKAGDEVDAAQLAKLVKLCKEKDVQVIIVEPQYPKGPAQSLHRELAKHGVNIRLAEVDPMETAVVVADGNPDPGLYLRCMRDNIDHLAKALP